jgi:hypothetical protein
LDGLGAGLDASDLLAAASRREQWAITLLFRAYQPLLLRYFRAQTPAVADDLAGEVWVAVARGLHRFAGDEAGFRAWLFTIARAGSSTTVVWPAGAAPIPSPTSASIGRPRSATLGTQPPWWSTASEPSTRCS